VHQPNTPAPVFSINNAPSTPQNPGPRLMDIDEPGSVDAFLSVDINDYAALEAIASSLSPEGLALLNSIEIGEDGSFGFRYAAEDTSASTYYQILDSTTPVEGAFHPLNAAAVHGTTTVDVQDHVQQNLRWQPEPMDQDTNSDEHPHVDQIHKEQRLEERTPHSVAIEVPTLGLTAGDGSVYLEVTPNHHPLLYAAAQGAPMIGWNKYVRVTYPPGFKRVRRLTRSHGWLPIRPRGRLPEQKAWHYFDHLKTYNCVCGKRWGSDSGQRQHTWTSNGVTKRDACCEVGLEVEQLDSFRPETMDPILDHYKVCQPLRELKSLIHKHHIEDSGLQGCEIDAILSALHA